MDKELLETLLDEIIRLKTTKNNAKNSSRYQKGVWDGAIIALETIYNILEKMNQEKTMDKDKLLACLYKYISFYTEICERKKQDSPKLYYNEWEIAHEIVLELLEIFTKHNYNLEQDNG